MKTFIPVYNMISSKFFKSSDVSYPTIEEIISKEDYVVLPQIQAKDLEDAYYILNMAHPINFLTKVNELSVNDPFHTKFPSLHTSLSVEDVLIEVITMNHSNETFKYHYCDSFCWKLLEWRFDK
jgi:hypothetical protein